MEPERQPSPADPEPPAGPEGARAAAPADLPAPPPPPLRRPRAATFLLAVVLLFPAAQAAQLLQPAAGLVWTQLFLFAFPAAALAGWAGLSPARFLGLAAPPPRALGLALLVGVAGLLVGGALQALWAAALPPRLLEQFDVGRLFRQSPLTKAVMIGAATGLAPICEELAFRGHLLSALRLRHATPAAIALSAVAFAALHLDPVRLPGLLFLGVLFAWLTFRSGSIYPAVLAHAVNNAAATALALEGRDVEAGAAAPQAGPAAVALLLGLAVLGPVLLAYHRALPAPPGPEASLAPGPGPAGRLPRWAVWVGWAAIVSLVIIALSPRR